MKHMLMVHAGGDATLTPEEVGEMVRLQPPSLRQLSPQPRMIAAAAPDVDAGLR